jgi:hypothetical protein
LFNVLRRARRAVVVNFKPQRHDEGSDPRIRDEETHPQISQMMQILKNDFKAQTIKHATSRFSHPPLVAAGGRARIHESEVIPRRRPLTV